VDKKIYNSLIEGASFNVRMWQKIVGILLVSNLLLALVLVMRDRSEKTIVVPAGLKKEFWVQGSEVSPSYLEQMSNYFLQLLLTYNKQNVLEQFKMVLHHVDPEKYAPLKSMFYIDAERVKKNELGSVFYPMKIKVNGMKVEVEGEHLGILGEKIVHRKIRIYQMNFNYKNGVLQIESYEEVGKEKE
jgi:conjugal transfer pilus assembly protein TraE